MPLDPNEKRILPAPEGFFDEAIDDQGNVRIHYRKLYELLSAMNKPDLDLRQQSVNRHMLEEGITFLLYGEKETEPQERTIPFDLIPRIIPRHEWSVIERGLHQRLKALNKFVWDIYHEQNILLDGLIPRSIVIGNPYFRPEMFRLHVPNGAYIFTAGIDLIRDESGQYYVLEDNLRCPSGFSYLYKSRSVMERLCPDLFFSYAVEDVQQSLNRFLASLRNLSPTSKQNPTIVLLTPGSYNAAYFEHAFLAQQMGIELVEGQDLLSIDHKVYIRGIDGYRQVDVIYRRIDDDFLDPLAFNPQSQLGIAGIMNAYRAGNVALANAPGTGVADDKAMYAYVPDMIRYYLNEEPILPNVPTYLLSRPEDRDYVLAHLPEMVVKERFLSGGYGMLIGPSAGEEELARFAGLIAEHPERYIAQPTKKLSVLSVLQDGARTPRHIDLRTFVLSGGNGDTHVIPGGLTRVAMKEGSLVVNSSQGGGCKDTWVLAN